MISSAMAGQRIEPLNDAEQRWVAAEVSNARNLVAQFNPGDASDTLTPEILDRAYRAARSSAAEDADSANAIINAIGMAFGQYLVVQLGFEWVAVFDDYGSEIAVVALPGQANMLVFPPNMVAKRWASGDTDFLSVVYKDIEEDLRKFQASWSAPSATRGPMSQAESAVKPSSWMKRMFGRGKGH